MHKWIYGFAVSFDSREHESLLKRNIIEPNCSSIELNDAWARYRAVSCIRESLSGTQFWSNHFVIGFYKAVRGIFSNRAKHKYAVMHQSPKPKSKFINLFSFFVELYNEYHIFANFDFEKCFECPFTSILWFIFALSRYETSYQNSSILNISNKILRVIESEKHTVRNIEYMFISWMIICVSCDKR